MDERQRHQDQRNEVSQDDWRLRAGCRGAPVAMFYAAPISAVVVRTCGRCYVSEQCLTAALSEERADGLSHGFRAGLTAAQRQRMLAGQVEAAA